MASFGRYIRLVLGAWALLLVIAVSMPSNAQQVNPTASSVKEQQLLQELNRVQGRVSIPDQRSGVLEQPAGRDWREFRNVTLRWIGSIAILGILAVLVIFYLSRGMVRLESGRSGRSIVRFTAFERFVHWMTATCFIILAISGLNITFGRPLRRCADLPDVDRRQHSEQGRCRLAQAGRRNGRSRPSPGLPFQCRPEGDLLDRRHRGRGCCSHRL
jgi:formate dehydrogenase subunit gamma